MNQLYPFSPPFRPSNTRDALLEDGWTVGFYTGDDKTGKDAFIEGDLDVLIATAAIGTGADRLQDETLDMAIFSLALMGANFADCLRVQSPAARCPGSPN